MADEAPARIGDLVRKSPANYEHFFAGLDDPGWIPVLAEEGFFREPVPPERGDDWIRFPNWAESRYLARVASKAPAEVVAVALTIPDTDNVRVHEDILEIALNAPGGQTHALVRRETEWLRAYEGHLMSLPQTAAKLIAHLAREGELDAALALAEVLLAVSEAPEATSSRKRAQPRTEEYTFGHIIEEAWPAVLDADPERGLRFLCDLLAQVIEIGFIEPGGGDYSYVWRSAIEDHAQNLGHSVLDTLIDAVRDGVTTVADGPRGIDLALAELSRHDIQLFKRLRLHLIQERGSAELVVTALTKQTNARDVALWHEYGELLRKRFADLTSAQRAAVLRVIEEGSGVERADDEDGRRERWWKLQRYVLIADYLDGDALAAYEELRGDFQEPEHPTFLNYSTSWTGPTSPYTSDELRELGPERTAAALRDWVPEPSPEAPSPEGLGRILEVAVAADSPAFAAAALEFRGLDRTYVRGLLGGLADAAKQGVAFDWGPPLELAEWVVEQPRGDDDESGFDRDPHWGWARKQVAGLFSRGFSDGAAEIPFSQRARVWRILAALAEDPDPTPDHEERYGGDNMDPLTLSINTTRGEAMHAVVRYLFWSERALGDGFNGLDSAPEARALLERHLDPSVDPALAIRAVYGQWFPQFVRMDRGWAESVAGRVFPLEPRADARFAAAWNAYVVWNRPFRDVFEVVADAYAHAIGRLDSHDGRTTLSGEPGDHLGQHLFTHRVVGSLRAEDPDLFQRFWLAADHELRGRVVSEIGRSLEQSPELEPAVEQRITRTWEWIAEVTRGDDPAALTGFGAWLAAQALPGGWLLEQAGAVLGVKVHLRPEFVVYAALERLAPEHPRLAVEVLRGMLMTDAEGWSLLGSTSEARTILAAGLASDDAEARRRAEQVAGLLVARGFSEFADVTAS